MITNPTLGMRVRAGAERGAEFANQVGRIRILYNSGLVEIWFDNPINRHHSWRFATHQLDPEFLSHEEETAAKDKKEREAWADKYM